MRLAGLQDADVAATLDKLQRKSGGDALVFLRALPAALGAVVTGKPVFAAVAPLLMKRAFLSVGAKYGRLLYLLARAKRARCIVEYGASYGISSIYLAAAAKANGGRLITTELDTEKAAAAERHLAEAGLSDVAQVRWGDARESLAPLAGPIDMLFLDGWPGATLEIVRMLHPRLASGAIVLADNIAIFPKTLRPFVAWMADPANGFETAPSRLGLALWVKT